MYEDLIQDKQSLDRVEVLCAQCNKSLSIQIKNLKDRIKSGRSVICKSCSTRISYYKTGKVKRDETMLARYGTIDPNQVPEFKEKIKQTNLSKYGVDCPLRLEGTRNKNLPEGISNVSQLPETKEKVKNTMRFRYGGYNLENKETLNKAHQTTKSKVDNRRLNIIDQVRDQLLAGVTVSKCKVDVSSTTLLTYLRQTNLDQYIKPSSIEEVLEVASLEDAGRKLSHFCETNRVYGFSELVRETFKLSKPSIKKALLIVNREDLLIAPISQEEQDFYDFLRSIYEGSIVRRSRSVIGPLELDFYLPELNLAFEYNGLIWHSELFSDVKDRHYQKMFQCENKSIQLITIFSSEWLTRQEQVKLFIKNLITTKVRLYARELTLCNNHTLLKDFIEKYHIQGNSKRSSFYVGLEHSEYGVVMALSLAPHHRDNTKTALNRVCLSEYSVVGGLERLLHHQPCDTLITWSDNRWSNGNMYKNSGFTLDDELPPDYFYTDGKNVFSKQSMKKSLTGCPSDVTECDWCWELGYYRVWDCGKTRWLWSKG